MDNNRKRALADVVSVEAWHQAFDEKNTRADLHVDVVFGTGRIGSEAASPVRFRLSLRQAEVLVIIPPTEPAKVDVASVSRDAPQIKVHATQRKKVRSTASVSGKIAAGYSNGMPLASLGLGVAGSETIDDETRLAITRAVGAMSVTQSRSEDGHYRWVVTPTLEDVLRGRPWDSAAPRLKIIDYRNERTVGLPPIVRVEVRCRRQDLNIEDISLKDGQKWRSIKRDTYFVNKRAAAESAIRDRLISEGLFYEDVEEIFASITIADVEAEAYEG
jgi:hypothetical protein